MRRTLAVIMFLMVIICAFGCAKPAAGPEPEYGEPVGSFHDNSDPEAPKSIVSNELVRFECALPWWEFDDAASAAFTLVRDGETAHVTAKVHGTYDTAAECTVDADALYALNSILVNSEAVQHNGHINVTDGVPPPDFSLTAEYASGERLRIYSSSTCMLPNWARNDIYFLFVELCRAGGHEIDSIYCSSADEAYVFAAKDGTVKADGIACSSSDITLIEQYGMGPDDAADYLIINVYEHRESLQLHEAAVFVLQFDEEGQIAPHETDLSGFLEYIGEDKPIFARLTKENGLVTRVEEIYLP